MGRVTDQGWIVGRVLVAVLALGPAGVAQKTELVTVSTAGVHGNQASSNLAMTPDGRFVSFTSYASNLVPGDSNNTFDQFLRDRQAGTTIRVSLSSTGAEANQGAGGNSSVSDDGRFVAFISSSTNLDPQDIDNDADVYVRDVLLGTTVLVSKSSSSPAHGGSFPVMSGDGRYVAFESSTVLAPNDVTAGPDGFDIYLRDLTAGTTTLVSVALSGVSGTGKSEKPTISADGRYIAFQSSADNLVGSDTHTGLDVFVRDMIAGTTSLASVSSAGVQGSGISHQPILSRTGQFLAFSTFAPELKAPYFSELVLRDLVAGTTLSVGLNMNQDASNPSISDDGRYVAFFQSTPFNPNFFVRDMTHTGTGLDTFNPVDVTPVGGPPNHITHKKTPTAISADGRYVAFESFASNLVVGDTNSDGDVFVRDIVWKNLGSALAGSAGAPVLAGTGLLEPNSLVTLTLSSANPLSASTLIVGVAQLSAPFKGGVMVPDPNFFFPLLTDSFGASSFGGLWPAGVPSDFTAYFQWWIQDPAGPKGFAASNAVAGSTP